MELKFTPEEGNMEQCDKDFQINTIYLFVIKTFK